MSFHPKMSERETCVAFAAEAGIVPALTVIRKALQSGPATRVLVFYDNHGEGDHTASVEELLALKDQHLDRLSVGFVMNREPDEPELLSGRLDAAKVSAIAERMFNPHTVREYFICGAAHLVEEIGGALEKIGVGPERIHAASATQPASSGSARAAGAQAPPATQSSGTQAVEAAVATGALTRVAIIMDGRRREFSLRRGEETILEAAARAGIELPSSCRAGVCATCRTKLVRGKVEMTHNYALEDWELEQGFILACQSHPTTPEIELTYDET